MHVVERGHVHCAQAARVAPQGHGGAPVEQQPDGRAAAAQRHGVEQRRVACALLHAQRAVGLCPRVQQAAQQRRLPLLRSGVARGVLQVQRSVQRQRQQIGVNGR